MIGLDDQQGSSTIDESFVAGLIVGEGSFHVIHVSRKASRREEYRPTFTIAMTDEETMRLVREAFDRWGLAYYFYDYRPKGHRKVYRIQVVGMKRVKRVLDHLLPLLTGVKWQAADTVRKFVDSRLAHEHDGQGRVFSDEEIALVAECSRINKGG